MVRVAGRCETYGYKLLSRHVIKSRSIGLPSLVDFKVEVYK